MATDDPKVSRRRFLRYTAGGAIVAGAGVGAGYLAGRHAGDVDRAGDGSLRAESENAIDSSLVRYDRTRTFDPKLRVAKVVAVGTDGRLVIAGSEVLVAEAMGRGAVRRFDCGSTVRAIVIEADGTLWVVTRRGVQVFSADGAPSGGWPLPWQGGLVTSIAVAGGDVFLADARHRQVVRCDRAGRLINRIGGSGPGGDASRFVVPSAYFDLEVDRDGLLWIANPGEHRVDGYSADGRLQASWGRYSPGVEGFCGCCNPVNFALLPDGRFVTCEKGILRVKVYRPGGELEAVVAGPSQFAAGRSGCEDDDCRGKALDVAASADGRVLVLDQAAGVVHVMAPRNEA